MSSPNHPDHSATEATRRRVLVQRANIALLVMAPPALVLFLYALMRAIREAGGDWTTYLHDGYRGAPAWLIVLVSTVGSIGAVVMIVESARFLVKDSRAAHL